MSEIQASTLMTEGLGLLDHGLADMSGRTIVSADEVVDLLLDLRMILAIAELRAPRPPGELREAEGEMNGRLGSMSSEAAATDR